MHGLPGRLTQRLLVLLVALLAGLTGLSFWRLAAVEDDLARMSVPENTLWSAAQTEVEVVRFLDSLGQHALGAIEKDELLTRFDLLWSRLSVYDAGQLAAWASANPEHASMVRELEAALHEVDPLVAALEPGDAAGAVLIRAKLLPFVAATRAVTLDNLSTDEIRRATLRKLHAQLRLAALLFGLALLAATVVLVAVLVHSDRTSRRLLGDAQRARTEADEARVRLSEAIEHINEGFVLYDRDDRLVMCNSKYRQIYAMSADVLQPGRTFEEILRAGLARGQYHDAKGREELWLEQRLARRRNLAGPFEQSLGDGRWLIVSDRRTQGGAVVGIRTDVTEIKLRQLALEEAHGRLEAQAAQMRELAEVAERARQTLLDAIESIGEGFSLFDAQDRLILCNSRYRAFYSRISDRIVPGIAFEDLLRAAAEAGHIVGAEGPTDDFIRTRQERRRASAQISFEERLDDGRWLRISNRRTSDDGLVSLFADITELKERELALTEARASLERQAAEMAALAAAAQRASAAKSQFLAMMSHEIRTPMNGVLGALGLLAGRPMSEEDRYLLQTAKQSGEFLLTILNDILDFTKIEAGKLALEPVSFNLLNLVDSALALCRIQAQGKGVALTLQVDPNLRPWLVGDAGRIRQMLLNYLSNAVKFTSHGRIEVRVVPLPGVGPNITRFQVADTGGGIPLERQHELFSDFTQLDGSMTRRHGGTGLGLAITKRLAMLMGGQVGFTSSPAAGSVFWFDVPLPPGEAGTLEDNLLEAPTKPLTLHGRPLRVLLAEDNGTNQLIARNMLERLGAYVDTVADGAEAVDAAASRSYDIVLMDLSMPVMDGLEASRRLRAMGVRTPIIALTADIMAENSGELAENGVNACLTKPASIGRLHGIISSILKDGKDEEGPSLSMPEALQPHAVLDHQKLDGLCAELDAEIVQQVLAAAIADIRVHSDILLGSVEPSRDEIRRAAHTLAGVAASIGASALEPLARTIEKGGMRQEVRGQLATAVEHTVDAIAEFTAAI